MGHQRLLSSKNWSQLVNRMVSVSSDKEELWTNLFSLGEERKSTDYSLVQNCGTRKWGCRITPSEDADDLTGKQFIARVATQTIW